MDERKYAVTNDWMHSKYRRVMIGSHTPDYDQLERYAWKETTAEEIRRYRGILTDVEPERLLRDLKKAGAEMFYYYAKCHYGNAYYPSRVPGAHVHSALKGRDLFGEYTQACLKTGIIPGAVAWSSPPGKRLCWTKTCSRATPLVCRPCWGSRRRAGAGRRGIPPP